MKMLTFFLAFLALIINSTSYSQGKNYWGVNFMPQAVWVYDIIHPSFGYSTGFHYLHTINTKAAIEIDLLYSQQKGFGICDIPITYNTNVPSIAASCISSKDEILKFIKVPVIVHHNFKEGSKLSPSIFGGLQPQYFLKEQSLLDRSNRYIKFYPSFICGVGIIKPIFKNVRLITQCRLEYTYTMFYKREQYNILLGLMIGIVFGKTD